MITTNAEPHPIVLVLTEPLLRATLAADLSAAGEDVVVVGDPADARLHATWRDGGVLIIETAALSKDDFALQVAGLHPDIWPGWLIVIGGTPGLGFNESRVAFVGVEDALANILRQLLIWRTALRA